MVWKTAKNARLQRGSRRGWLGYERLERRDLLAADFLSFEAGDASGDDSPLTTFESSALAVNYQFNPDGQLVSGIDIFARQGERTLKLGEHSAAVASDLLLSLEGFTDLTGAWDVFASARTSSGEIAESASVNLRVLPTSDVSGDYRAETFSFAASPDSAAVYSGGGGTDTLSLGVFPSSVVSFNGAPLASFTSNSLVDSQAIYAGTAFDYLRLSDGSEIYLQGIERLQFSNGSAVELQTRPNDPRFNQQWNLAIADVPDAWRFTRGSEDVLVVSIDTGIPISNGTPTFSDLESDRLIFRGAADGASHGHNATTIFAAEANNGDGAAGINWESPVLVLDVYGGDDGNIGINTAINTALAELGNTEASRIVFQGGVQGEFWLNVLDQSLWPGIEANTLFAVAAGNGGQDISITSHPNGLSGGFARLEGVYDNVISVGALQHNATFVNGQRNASNVFLAGYSNFGENLTFAAPTDSPSRNPSGSNTTFGGTSAANPNVAGYASLVWSANPSLIGGEVRQLLAETATDVGAAGRDSTFGHGIPNAGAAVRRAWALNANSELAALDVNPFSLSPELPGDFNLDGLVSAADFAVWRDASNARVVQYTGADANGDSLVNGVDYATWEANFGANFITTTLIDATTGNGEFAADSEDDVASFGGAGDPIVVLNRDRAFVQSATEGHGVSVDGWSLTRLGYSGGNNTFGIDGVFGFATDAGTGAGQTGQAFVNSGVIEVRSDRIDQTLLAGESLELSYLLGSDNASANPEATVTLIFDQGLPTEFTHTFDTVTAAGVNTPAITHEYELPTAVSSTTVSFTLDGVVSGHRALLDRVTLQAVRPSTLASSAAASLALAQSDGRSQAIDAPADRFPAVGETVTSSTPSNLMPAGGFPPTILEDSGATSGVEIGILESEVSSRVADEALLLLFIDRELGESDSEEFDFTLNGESRSGRDEANDGAVSLAFAQPDDAVMR